MINHNKTSSKSSNETSSINADEEIIPSNKKKGPLSFLSGAVTSVFFAWFSFLMSKKVVVYFTLHSPDYSSPIAQSIASAMKTLVVGMCFLATFTFSFIGLGLIIVFIRSLFSFIPAEDD